MASRWGTDYWLIRKGCPKEKVCVLAQPRADDQGVKRATFTHGLQAAHDLKRSQCYLILVMSSVFICQPTYITSCLMCLQ